MKTALLVAALVCAFFVEGTSSYPGALLSSKAGAAYKQCNAFALATLIVKRCVDLPNPEDFPGECCASVYLALGQEGCMCEVKNRSFFHLSPLDDRKAMDVVMERCRASPLMYSILHGCDEDLPPPPPSPSTAPTPTSQTEKTPVSHPPNSQPPPLKKSPPDAAASSAKSASSRSCNSFWVSLFAAIMGWLCAAVLLTYMIYKKYTQSDHRARLPDMELLNRALYRHILLNEDDEASNMMHTRDMDDEVIQDGDGGPDIDEHGLVVELGLAVASTGPLLLPHTTTVSSFASRLQSDHHPQGVLDLQASEISFAAPTGGHSIEHDEDEDAEVTQKEDVVTEVMQDQENAAAEVLQEEEVGAADDQEEKEAGAADDQEEKEAGAADDQEENEAGAADDQEEEMALLSQATLGSSSDVYGLGKRFKRNNPRVKGDMWVNA